MANNLKISDLPFASNISDDALVVLVQDHSNKVVTVSELSSKINEVQNNSIDKLWHELRRVTNADTIRSLSNALANHEYRIDGIEKLNGNQDAQLTNLTEAMQTMANKQAQHSSDIRLLRTATTENRRSLAYLNCRVDALINDSSAYFSQISELSQALKEAVAKHEDDLAYTYQYISDVKDTCYSYASTYVDLSQSNSYAYTSYEVDNNWAYTYSSYAYISEYVHFGGDEYWGVISKYDEIYTGIPDNYTPSNNTTPTDCDNNCGC